MANPPPPVTGHPAPNPNQYIFSHQPQPPPGSTYPYAAPPPQTYPYYNNQQNNSYYNPQRRATFLRRVFSIITASIIITGTIICIIFLVLRPRLPHFRVDSFSVTSPFNLTTTNRLNTSWDLSLTAVNPNEKLTLYYDDIQAGIFYMEESLGVTYFPPFVQGKKSQSEMNGSFVAENVFVEYDDVVGMNEEKAKNNGNVGFNVVVVADVRFKTGIWRVRRSLLRVYCGNLVVNVEGNGSSINNGLIGGHRQCRVV